jgi:putative membrane protein insertion efficiency factor|uniref:Putative membrane protein insertion efficiency factor n=1 Tax=candidate division WOR-3 bacterium TaxID=2052148 RepID=A0A7V3PT75_UNCW3
MTEIMRFLIRFYQWTLGTILPNSCRFSPSCSEYAYQAVTRFGWLKGCWLAIKRICRCHPLYPGGYDPLPEKFNYPKGWKNNEL